MDLEVVYKPNPVKIKQVLEGYHPDRVKFILDFVSAVLCRLRDGTLKNYNWPQIAEDLGIRPEVTAIIQAFDVPEVEFWRKYGRSTREIAENTAKELKEAFHGQED